MQIKIPRKMVASAHETLLQDWLQLTDHDNITNWCFEMNQNLGILRGIKPCITCMFVGESIVMTIENAA